MAAFRNSEDTSVQRHQTLSFLDQIRSIYFLSHVPFVFIPEAAPSDAGVRLAGHVYGYPNLQIMKEAAGGRAGVPIRADLKRSLILAGQTTLGRGNMRPIERCVAMTNHPTMVIGNATFETTLDYLLALLCQQTKSFHARVRPTSDGLSEKVSYTGKGYGTNDDLVMAFLMSQYWSIQFLVSTNKEYTDFKRRLAHSRTKESQRRGASTGLQLAQDLHMRFGVN